MGTKLEDSFIICDTCNIRMGPKYLANRIYDFGPLKICPFCLKEIYKNGRIIIRIGKHVRMLTSKGDIIEYMTDDVDSYTVTSLGSNNIPNLESGFTPISQL